MSNDSSNFGEPAGQEPSLYNPVEGERKSGRLNRGRTGSRQKTGLAQSVFGWGGDRNSDDRPDAIKPARLPWNPWLAVVYAVAAFFVAQVVASALIMLYPLLRGWGSAASSNWLDTSIVAQFWFTVLAEALTFGAVWLFVHKRRSRLQDIGWRWPQWRDPLRALGGFLIYFLAYVVLIGVAQALFPSLNVDQKQELGFQAAGTGLNVALVFASLVILPPLVEETVFRGFIFTSLRGRLGPVVATVLTSALFASAHLQFGSGKPLLWVAAIDTFALSLVLCYLRAKTGSLWPGIILHALKNCIAFFALFVIGVH